MKKLFEYEADYFEAYDRAIDWAEMGCTLKELVEEIGFNNITILNPFEEDTDKKYITNIYYGGNKYENMNDIIKNIKVILSSTYTDLDGYTCANIELENKEDWKLFKEALGNDNK